MVLEKLQSINWACLNHAYGDALDVPILLWALSSSNRRDRGEALQTLYSNIWHQGTVYEATSFAVPFLCELARIPTVRGRVRILGLLQAIASAYPQAATLPDPLWREPPSPREISHHSLDAHWARKAEQAVAAEVDTFLALLTDPSPRVRTAAAFTLAFCRDRFAEIDQPLQKRIADERQPTVKGALIHVWASLWKKSGGPPDLIIKKLKRLVRDRREKTLVRLVSVIAHLQFLPEGKYPKLVRFLATTLRRSGKAVTRLFDVGEALANHQDLKVALFLDLARKPGHYAKGEILTGLELLCRERRSNFAIVVPALGQILRECDPDFRRTVVIKMCNMGTWVRFAREALAEVLHDGEREVALWSAQALSKLRDPRVLPFLLDNLTPEKHSDPPASPITKTSPIPDLFRIRQAVGKHLNGLRLLLDALRPYGPAGYKALPHLRVLLTKRGPEIQKLVCNALAHIGQPAEDSVPIVAGFLRNPELQNAAAWALMHWGGMAATAFVDLIRFLQDFPEADSCARISAIKALGTMGPSARDALPILKKSLSQAHYSDAATRSEAALAVWRIAPQTPGVIELIIDELTERTKPGWATHGCSQFVEALEAIGPPARSAEPLLQKLLTDADGWSRIHAARALWKIGGHLDVVLPVLINDLLCRPLGIAAGLLAAECLAEIGPPAAAAIPRIEEIFATEASLGNYGSQWVENDEAYQNALKHALHSIGNRSGVGNSIRQNQAKEEMQ